MNLVLKGAAALVLSLAVCTSSAQDNAKAGEKAKTAKKAKSKKTPEPPAWIKSLTDKPVGKFALPASAEFTFQAGVPKFENAGQLKLTLTNAGGTIRAQGTSGSVGAAEAAWAYKNKFLSVVKGDTLLPVAIEQSEEDPVEINTYAAEFSADGIKGSWNTDYKDGKTAAEKRDRAFSYKGAYDLIGAFLYIRSQELNDGDSFTLLTYPQRDPYVVTFKVVGREKADKLGTEVDAIKLSIEASKVDKKGNLKPMGDKIKGASFYLSDDADRLPLAFDASILIGSASGKLTGYTPK